MAKGGKNISGSAKPIIFMLCAAGALILLLAAFYSFGWFTNNKETSGDMAALRATDADFELAAVGESGIYDDYLTAQAVCSAGYHPFPQAAAELP